MKRIVIGLFMTGLFILITSFSWEEFPTPVRKIQNAAAKLWKDKSLKLLPLARQSCVEDGRFFGLLHGADTLGYVFVGRANSCRSGGCFAEESGNKPMPNLQFEYFDYFIIYGSRKQIKRIQIYNYQATHGQEVMSRGWLNQFKGYEGKQTLEYGKDVEAISGATVSAMAMIDNLQLITTCLRQTDSQ